MTSVAERTAWMDQALCANRDPEIWFDERRAEAKRICAECPVSQQCGALGGDEYRGIWGGVKQSRVKVGASPSIEYLGFPHGTEGGYSRHIREDTPPCARCSIAHTFARRDLEAKRPPRVRTEDELEQQKIRRRERRQKLRKQRARVIA